MKSFTIVINARQAELLARAAFVCHELPLLPDDREELVLLNGMLEGLATADPDDGMIRDFTV